ncbi:hypothetical protein [Chitinophaga sp. 212800010-3]|uniref:hypothetical protein n=1 Tax=unclassified Chitinophaga TaxID=2619133 RepID=UPI002E120EA1
MTGRGKEVPTFETVLNGKPIHGIPYPVMEYDLVNPKSFLMRSFIWIAGLLLCGQCYARDQDTALLLKVKIFH